MDLGLPGWEKNCLLDELVCLCVYVGVFMLECLCMLLVCLCWYAVGVFVYVVGVYEYCWIVFVGMLFVIGWFWSSFFPTTEWNNSWDYI